MQSQQQIQQFKEKKQEREEASYDAATLLVFSQHGRDGPIWESHVGKQENLFAGMIREAQKGLETSEVPIEIIGIYL